MMKKQPCSEINAFKNSDPGDFKCREVKTGFCGKRSLQTGSLGISLAGNVSYGTEWRERGDGLWRTRHFLLFINSCGRYGTG
jgi:hypothetical protein